MRILSTQLLNIQDYDFSDLNFHRSRINFELAKLVKSFHGASLGRFLFTYDTPVAEEPGIVVRLRHIRDFRPLLTSRFQLFIIQE